MKEQNQQPPDEENNPTSNQSKNQQPPHSAKQPKANHPNPLPEHQQISHSDNEQIDLPNSPDNNSIKTTSPLESLISILWVEFINKINKVFKVYKPNLVFQSIILAFLAGFGGMNFAKILETQPSELMAQDEICKELNTKLVVKEVNVIASPPDATVDNVKFGCEYITKSGEKQTLYVQYKAWREVKHNYEQEPIEERHRQTLCGDSRLYLPKLQEKGYSETEYNFIDQEAVLLEKKEAPNIYPVFRWICEYKLTRKNPLPENKLRQGGEGLVIKVQTGLHMDKNFCQQRFRNRNLNKATYHDHNDPYSWYCTNTEFDLN